jgi:hypothetical protein
MEEQNGMPQQWRVAANANKFPDFSVQYHADGKVTFLIRQKRRPDGSPTHLSGTLTVFPDSLRLFAFLCHLREGSTSSEKHHDPS